MADDDTEPMVGLATEVAGGLRPLTVVQNLRDATNRHDLEAIVACFAPDYRNETPVHPTRGFVGRDQVRRNWRAILSAVADVETEIVASATSGDTVWTQWRHSGTRADGSQHLMAGVIIFRVADDLIQSALFFLEPVHVDPVDADEAVRRQVNAVAS
jgi:ketosteroid isomerase-like protein